MVAIQLHRVPSLFSEGLEEDPPNLKALHKRKQALLREGLGPRLRRIGGALLHFARSSSFLEAPEAIDLLLRDALVRAANLPRPSAALDGADGLCGIVRGISPELALEAYASGLVLHGSLGPVCWCSPAVRWVAQPGALGGLEAAADEIAKRGAVADMDGDIEDVILACSRAELTTGRLGYGAALMRIYSDLAERGLVHAIRIRDAQGRTIAGAFGLAIGKVFMTEGTFGPGALARSALILLDRQLALRDFTLHEARLGPTPGSAPGGPFAALQLLPIARADFIAIADRHLSTLRSQRWKFLPGSKSEARGAGRMRPRRALASAA